MKKSDLNKIAKAEKSLYVVNELLKSKKIWSEKDLLEFTDLRQTCNLIDFNIEQECEKLPNYND